MSDKGIACSPIDFSCKPSDVRRQEVTLSADRRVFLDRLTDA